MELLAGEMPSWLQVDRTSGSEDRHLYSMFSNKLLPETWHELQQRRLVKFERHGDFNDYASHTYLGLTLMAILARSCSGTLKHTITDQNDSYYALLKHLQFLSGEHESSAGTKGSTLKQPFTRWLKTLGATSSRTRDKTRETLVSVSLDVIDAKDLSVENLLTLRHDKSKFAAELRQNYAKSVEDYIDKISAASLTKTNATALAEDFRNRMGQDLDRLRAELKLQCPGLIVGRFWVTPEGAIRGDSLVVNRR